MQSRQRADDGLLPEVSAAQIVNGRASERTICVEGLFSRLILGL